METEPIELHHQALFHSLWQPLCQSLKRPCSEFSFANTFLFRRQHSYRLIKSDPTFILGRFYKGGEYIIPTGPLPEILPLVKKYLSETGTSLFPIPEEWIPIAEAAGLRLSMQQGDSDYLYSVDKLKMLSGRNLASRRNLIHQLKAHYASLECMPLTEERVPEAMRILDAWQDHSRKSKEETDYSAASDALTYMKKLGLYGRILYGDGTPLGWTLGEPLSQSTALFHFTKQLPGSKGVTPYLYQDFALQQPEGIAMINLEQDLDIPSLRQAKKAYQPDLLAGKWRATL